MIKKYRLLYIVSHPIQYQAPLSRLISRTPNLDLSTLFYWDKPSGANFDKEFGLEIKWDVPLLEGYRSDYLGDLVKKPSLFSKLFALWEAINPRKYDVVWTHGYADIYTISAILFAKLKGIRVFVRGDSALFPDNEHSKTKKLKRKLLFKILNSFVDRFLSVGKSNTDFYLHFGVPKKKITLCHYAVDNNFFKEKFLLVRDKMNDLKKNMGLEKDRLIILYAGKFITRKFPIDLLNAYKLLCQNSKAKTPYLLFIGTGETLDAVKAEAVDLNCDFVRFLGFKNQSELPDYFSVADIFVSPAIHENWGLIVNEVMNAECAIIATDHTACAGDLVRQG
ncbi:MAG: glycosyltransferase family 4 protein, partial [Gammaproteobacteria bacterium]|nr:glycosyltransferase family 4 protein [Gammaproteobacteria bacterium]